MHPLPGLKWYFLLLPFPTSLLLNYFSCRCYPNPENMWIQFSTLFLYRFAISHCIHSGWIVWLWSNRKSIRCIIISVHRCLFTLASHYIRTVPLKPTVPSLHCHFFCIFSTAVHTLPCSLSKQPLLKLAWFPLINFSGIFCVYIVVISGNQIHRFNSCFW